MTIEPRARQAGGLTGFIREALGLEIECNVQDLRHWTAGDWFLLQQAETALPGVIVDASGSSISVLPLATSGRWCSSMVRATAFIVAMQRAGCRQRASSTEKEQHTTYDGTGDHEQFDRPLAKRNC